MIDHSPKPVPTLDAIVSDAAAVRGLPKATLSALLLRNAAVATVLAAELANGTHEAPVATISEADRMLTVDEAALLLRRSRQWIYRHPGLPFVKRISRKSLLCSEAGVKRWLATRGH